MSGPVTNNQLLDMFYKMHVVSRVMIERCEDSMSVLRGMDGDLVHIVADLMVELHFLQVTLGLTAGVYRQNLQDLWRGGGS